MVYPHFGIKAVTNPTPERKQLDVDNTAAPILPYEPAQINA